MVVSKTPLRVSLFGGGTDFPEYYIEHDGKTISMAIDKYVYVIAKRRFDTLIRVGYTKTELVPEVADLEHELIRETLLMLGYPPDGVGVELNTMADIPTAGSGLGSSASVVSGVIRAISALQGHTHTRSYVTQLAHMVEKDRLGRAVGLQDQVIVNFGGFRRTTYNEGGFSSTKFAVDATILNDLSDCLLLFFTGLTRNATDVLTEQVSNMERNLDALAEMKVIVEHASRSLLNGDLENIGLLLNDSWKIKCTLADQISNPEIEDVYADAKNAGALGGKLCGAGGGGFMLLYCEDPEYRQDVRAMMAIHEWPELEFRIDPYGSRVVYRGGS